MNRSTTLTLLAIGLLGYGVYAARYLPAMLVETAVPALAIGFILQVVCALAAALGVWRDKPWAAGVVVLLGVIVAATWLFEAFVVGIVAYLHAVFAAVCALVVTLFIAAYVGRRRWTTGA